jgi:hypothetical protein
LHGILQGFRFAIANRLLKEKSQVIKPMTRALLKLHRFIFENQRGKSPKPWRSGSPRLWIHRAPTIYCCGSRAETVRSPTMSGKARTLDLALSEMSEISHRCGKHKESWEPSKNKKRIFSNIGGIKHGYVR